VEIFESEALLSISSRKIKLETGKELSSFKDQPYSSNLEVEKPKEIFDKAVSTTGSNIKSSSTVKPNNKIKRIYLEFKSIKTEGIFQVFMNNNDHKFWKLLFKGETGTLYADGIWVIYVSFPEEYPISPPEVRFINKIYHCNISNDGKICHEILTSKWSPHVSMKKIIEEISSMLTSPNPDDALDSIKGSLLKSDKKQYEEDVKKWVLLYASKSEQELKEIYKLE